MVQEIDALISITTTATRTEGGYPVVMHIKFCSDDSTSQRVSCPYDSQPRPQGFSLKKWVWVGREKALASAGHVSLVHPKILGVIN